MLTTISVLLLSSLVAASECDDSHIANVNKRGMIQCVMRGVDDKINAPSHPVSVASNGGNTNTNTDTNSGNKKPELASPTAPAKAPAHAPPAHGDAPSQAPAQAPIALGDRPAQANYASKPQVEIGLGIALAMCLLL